ERVGAVEVVSTEQLGLDACYGLGDLRETGLVRAEQSGGEALPGGAVGVRAGEGVGYVAAERGQHCAHAELALPGEDLPGQVEALVEPALGQRTAEAVRAAHQRPGQVRGRTEPGAHLGRVGAVVGERAGEDGHVADHQDRKSTRLNSSHVSISY